MPKTQIPSLADEVRAIAGRVSSPDEVSALDMIALRLDGMALRLRHPDDPDEIDFLLEQIGGGDIGSRPEFAEHAIGKCVPISGEGACPNIHACPYLTSAEVADYDGLLAP